MSKKKVLLLLIVVFIASGLFYKRVFKVQPSQSDISQNDSLETKTADDQADPKDKADGFGVVTTQKNVLDLSGQRLEKLPAYVLKLTNLEELNISDNNLTGALPAEINDLRNLTVLDASNNQMTGIPAEVGQLQNLEVLNLANNKLTGLPYELGNLKKLKKLNLSGNDYAVQNLEVIKRGLSPEVILVL